MNRESYNIEILKHFYMLPRKDDKCNSQCAEKQKQNMAQSFKTSPFLQITQ